MFSLGRSAVWSAVALLLILSANNLLLTRPFDNVRMVAIYVAVTLVTGFLAVHRRTPPRAGWHQLTPSAMEWVALTGAIGFTALMVWIYYFVGSSRPDAPAQMATLRILIFAFSIGAAIVFLSSFSSDLRWSNERIEQRRLGRPAKIICWKDLTGAGVGAWSGLGWATGADGTVIRFSLYQSGAPQLLDEIRETLEEDGPHRSSERG